MTDHPWNHAGPGFPDSPPRLQIPLDYWKPMPKPIDHAVQKYNTDYTDGRYVHGNAWGENGPKPAPKVDEFLSDVLAVCRKHGLSLSHEDRFGSFIVTKFAEENANWLASAGVSGLEDPL